MASNFQILFNRTRDSVHLKLFGDFDGTSAHELLNLLKNNSRDTSKIYIHTDGLKHILPFGREIFNRSLGVKKNRGGRIVFKGKKAHDFYYKLNHCSL